MCYYPFLSFFMLVPRSNYLQAVSHRLHLLNMSPTVMSCGFFFPLPNTHTEPNTYLSNE